MQKEFNLAIDTEGRPQVVIWPVGQERQTSDEVQYFDLKRMGELRSKEDLLASVKGIIGNEAIIRMSLSDTNIAMIVSELAQLEVA